MDISIKRTIKNLLMYILHQEVFLCREEINRTDLIMR